MLKKLLSVYGSNLFLGVLGVVSVPILLNNIGTEGYGYYAIYLTILSYFSLFELGVLKHITKLVSQKITEVDEVISCFYFVTLCIVLLMLPIILVIVGFLYPINFYTVLTIGIIASLEYIFFLSTKIHSAYATANKNFEKLSLYNFISGSFRYLLIIVGAIVFKDIFIIIFLLVVRRIFDISLSKKVLKTGITLFNIKKVNMVNLKKIIGFYKESIFLSGTQVIQINISGLISLLISRLFGIQELGVYRSITDLFSKVYFFSNGIGLVIFPYFAGGNTKDRNNKKYIYFSWTFYTLVYICILVLFPYLNAIFLNNIVDSNMQLWMVMIIVISIFLVAQGNLSFEYLQAKGMYSNLLKIALLSCMIFLITVAVFYKLNLGVLSILTGWLIYVIIQSISYEWIMLNKNKVVIFIDSLIVVVWLIIGILLLGLSSS